MLRANFVCWIVALGLLAGCGSSGLREYELNETSFNAETLQMIQADSGVTLPKGTRGLNFYYKPPIDPAFVAKLQIPKDSTEAMVQQISAIKPEQINISGELGPRKDWWVPKDAKILVDRQSSPKGNYLRTTVTTEGDRTILYVEWEVF